ncbi:MAG: phosphopyruvate hydratase [Candidatus Lokiarchaeota archaeon]|nr:phosphopyruvate hydratase [Candidatus Lokiarchaeota archaeon]
MNILCLCEKCEIYLLVNKLDAFLIDKIKARWVLDSRGNPTVEVDVFTRDGFMGRGAVPSGASTGEYEAVELRDKDKAFAGKGVLKALKNINGIIAPKVKSMDVREQEAIDNTMIELDRTENKGNLGANAILAVSMAVSRTAAQVLSKPLYVYLKELIQASESSGEVKFLLPTPHSNVINGGEHAGNNLAIQEFMIMPISFATFRNAIQGISEVYHALKAVLMKKYGPIARNVGDEGGMAPPMTFTTDAMDALVTAIEEAGYSPKSDFLLAMDAAASEFFENDVYHIDEQELTPMELLDYYSDLVQTYPIASLEDPFEENDYNSFAALAKAQPSLQVVTDDLTVTNLKRLKTAIDLDSGNCLLLKVNQIGTLTESIAAAKLSFDNNWGVVVSHRSGETEDSFIADFSAALSCGQIKTGAPCRSDRTAKYNQLLRIEDALQINAEYAGKNFGTAYKQYL